MFNGFSRQNDNLHLKANIWKNCDLLGSTTDRITLKVHVLFQTYELTFTVFPRILLLTVNSFYTQ